MRLYLKPDYSDDYYRRYENGYSFAGPMITHALSPEKYLLIERVKFKRKGFTGSLSAVCPRFRIQIQSDPYVQKIY